MDENRSLIDIIEEHTHLTLMVSEYRKLVTLRMN